MGSLRRKIKLKNRNKFILIKILVVGIFIVIVIFIVVVLVLVLALALLFIPLLRGYGTLLSTFWMLKNNLTYQWWVHVDVMVVTRLAKGNVCVCIYKLAKKIIH